MAAEAPRRPNIRSISRVAGCPVCLESLIRGSCYTIETDPDIRFIQECGHLAHYACLERWFSTAAVCPICFKPTIPGRTRLTFTDEVVEARMSLRLESEEFQRLTTECAAFDREIRRWRGRIELLEERREEHRFHYRTNNRLTGQAVAQAAADAGIGQAGPARVFQQPAQHVPVQNPIEIDDEDDSDGDIMVLDDDEIERLLNNDERMD